MEISSAAVYQVTTDYNNVSSSNTTSSSFAGVTILASNTLQIIYLIIATFGFFSNIYVIVVIGLYKPMHKQLTTLYIVNQSIIDTVVALFLFLTTVFADNGGNKYKVKEIPREYWKILLLIF